MQVKGNSVQLRSLQESRKDATVRHFAMYLNFTSQLCCLRVKCPSEGCTGVVFLTSWDLSSQPETCNNKNCNKPIEAGYKSRALALEIELMDKLNVLPDLHLDETGECKRQCVLSVNVDPFFRSMG